MKLRNWVGVLIISLIVALFAGLPVTAVAATKNFAETVPGIQMVPFQISGQWTATTASVVKFQIPFKAEVLGVSATARASGGTSPTLTVDVKEAGVTLLSAPIAITAGTVSEGTVTDNIIADEATVTVDLTITGTSPTWNDITVILTLRRTN